MSLGRCPEGHLFSTRRYGNLCPYCSKTVLLSSRPSASEDELYNDDMSLFDNSEVIDPVTGWLVCIEGPSQGRDYKIRTEKNFVGRSDGMDVQILGDNSVSKKNHAVIVYDPKKRQTLLLPGDAHGLVYHNGSAIYAPVELMPYDTVELGKTKLLFVPLCGEHFEWPEMDDVKDNAKKDADSDFND